MPLIQIDEAVENGYRVLLTRVGFAVWADDVETANPLAALDAGVALDLYVVEIVVLRPGAREHYRQGERGDQQKKTSHGIL
jgi:hypothetical protein